MGTYHVVHRHALALQLAELDVRRLNHVDIHRMAHLVAPGDKVFVMALDDVIVGLRPRENLLDLRLGSPLHSLGPPLLCQRDVPVVHIDPESNYCVCRVRVS